MNKNTRRKFIQRTLGGLGIGIVGVWIFRRPILNNLFFNADFNPKLLNTAPSNIDDLCILTTKQAEGPFFFPSPERIDIREDREGQKLELKFQVLRHDDCQPIEGAIVDIWHCDAEGTYSGYPEEITHDVWKSALFIEKNSRDKNGEIHVDPVNDNRFLRGRQTSDKEGWVSFKTILPGWYVGRVPHIHASIITSEKDKLMTQFYFDPDLCNKIYTSQTPYDQYGESPMKFENDIVLADNDEANGLLLNVNSEGQTLTALAKIGIKTA